MSTTQPSAEPYGLNEFVVRDSGRPATAPGRVRSSSLRIGVVRVVRILVLLGLAIGALGLTAAGATANLTHVYATSFGTGGSGAGQLSLGGGGLAANLTTGDVYVADTDNFRIDQFTEKGEFVRAWGWGVATGADELQVCTATCQKGLAGTGSGEHEPLFVTVDNSGGPSEGDVYVAEADNAVSKFDAEGHLVTSWGDEGQLREAPQSAAGTGKIASGEASGVGDFVAARGQAHITSGSKTVEDLVPNTKSEYSPFAVGMAVSVEQGIPAGTTITAVGSGTLTLSNAATMTGQISLKAGLDTVENVSTTSGSFEVGQGVDADRPGIQTLETYITAVGAHSLTLSQPPEYTVEGAEIHSDKRFVTGVHTTSGTFEEGLTVSGAGIPAGTGIEYAGPGYFYLTKDASAGGAEIALTGKFDGFDLVGIAVDSSGDLWIRSHLRRGPSALLEFAPGGALIATEHTEQDVGGGGIAIGPAGEIYMPTGSSIVERSSAGAELGAIENGNSQGSGESTGIAVDPTTAGELYVLRPEASGSYDIKHFAPSCVPVLVPGEPFCSPADIFATEEEPAAGQLGVSPPPGGLAVGRGHIVYAVNDSGQDIIAYKQVAQPGVTTGGVSNPAQATVTLEGEVNPEGIELSECFFEYGETAAYGEKAPCAESPAQIGAGDQPVAVHADVEGLLNTFYHYRLVARNENLPVRGADQIFGATIDSTVVRSAGATEATLAATIDPHGLETTCQLQYVTASAFAESAFAAASSLPCEPASLGSGTGDQLVRLPLSGLVAGTNYRFRFVAVAAGHTTDGPAEYLFTPSGGPAASGCVNEQLREENNSETLPDCRAYEQVSSADNASVYQPVPASVDGGEGYLVEQGSPAQGAANGGSITYVGEAPSSGEEGGTGNTGGGEGDEHLATRGETSWHAADIAPLGSSSLTYFEGFSPDLSVGVIVTAGREPRPLAPGVETSCSVIYSRASAGGVYSPLFLTEIKKTCVRPFFVGGNSGATGVPQFSHLLFESSAAKVEGAKRAAGTGHENVYDAFGGQLYLVNILPGANPTADPDATLGSLATEREAAAGEPFGGEIVNGQGQHIPSIDTSNAVSADGSRIFWTDLATGIVYVRENDSQEPSAMSGEHCTESAKACTVQVSSGAATYWTATPDGHYAYYTEGGELWRFDVDTEAREPLTPIGTEAEVQGVIGANETGPDGAYLYFVAAGKLTADAEARDCTGKHHEFKAEEQEEADGGIPADRGCNLYVIHEGVTALVTVLAPSDYSFEGYNYHVGDWRAVLGLRSAEPTPDGSHLVFMSTRQLTAYRNDVTAGGCRVAGSIPVASCPEIYLYDAATAKISCVSCNPTGAPPVETSGVTEPVTYLPADGDSDTHMRRWISFDGDRVFFDTREPLLAQDGNGKTDVYEWERQGSGSCTAGSALDGGGCLYLISDAGGDGSHLIDTDEAGNNVFFLTSDGLLPGQLDETAKLYDARVGGGFAGHPGGSVAAPSCESAEACKPPPSEPPVESFPASAAFSGAGDLPFPSLTTEPGPTIKTKPKSKAKKCKQGYAKKKGKCVKAKRGKKIKHRAKTKTRNASHRKGARR